MTTHAEPTPHARHLATDGHPLAWQRLSALSGVAFVPFFVVGWLTSGGNSPHYNAGDQAWTNWGHDKQYKGRISAFAMLLAAFIFLYFTGAVRSMLESAESPVRGSAQLARVAYAGA